MALIPPFVIECVVAIGGRISKGEMHWFDTDFLVGRHNKKAPAEQKNYYLYLVTNKHVLKNVESIIVRFNPQTEESVRDYDISFAPCKELLLVEHLNPDNSIL